MLPISLPALVLPASFPGTPGALDWHIPCRSIGCHGHIYDTLPPPRYLSYRATSP